MSSPVLLLNGSNCHEESPLSTPDGQRLLMIQEVAQDSAAPQQIHVVLNRFEELKQRVPVQ